MFSSKVIAAAIEILADCTWSEVLAGFTSQEIRQVALCLEADGADDLAAEIDGCADNAERVEEMGA